MKYLTFAYFDAQTGDPIEAAAIDSVFGRNRGSDSPVFIGSVKTNIGHLEPASGFASVIKVTLALERGLIPPSINYDSPNPKLGLESSRLKVSAVPCKSRMEYSYFIGTNSAFGLAAWISKACFSQQFWLWRY